MRLAAWLLGIFLSVAAMDLLCAANFQFYQEYWAPPTLR
jgi:hypothetical protein